MASELPPGRALIAEEGTGTCSAGDATRYHQLVHGVPRYCISVGLERR
jgi:hypothetical protein